MRRQLNLDELDALYRKIGKGIWHLQYVEDVLHTLITLKVEVKTPGWVTHEKAQQLLAKHRRNTLGTSLRIAKESNLVTSSLEAQLAHFKEERDWLVHRSLNSYSELLYTDEGRAEMFERLEKFLSEATVLQRAIANELASYAESHGISVAGVEARAQAKIARLKGEPYPFHREDSHRQADLCRSCKHCT